MTDATKKLFFDLFASEFAQARTEGRNEGRNEGRIEGRNEGRIEGTREGKLNQIVSFYQKNYITLQQACDEANMNKEEFLKLV